jgi:hypothetical protein
MAGGKVNGQPNAAQWRGARPAAHAIVPVEAAFEGAAHKLA